VSPVANAITPCRVNFRRAARAADRALTNLDPNRDLIGPDVAPKWHYEDRWSPRMKIEDRRGEQIAGRSAAGSGLEAVFDVVHFKQFN
jgi:hypothetical protein